MGEVYRARDTRLNRTVAIKVLPSHLSATPEWRQRFEREARAISSLQHPHICTLHDVGRQNGIDYLVLEYLEGETLDARLRKGPLPLDQLLKIAIEIADALDHAHRQRIVHRDLKPGNIILSKSGAKLTDFGLAKPTDTPLVTVTGTPTLTNSPLTGEGKLVGTFQYMAPEQLEGREADARSDIFSLGCVLYEMATGRPAFHGESPLSVLAFILEREPEPLAKVKPLTPPALDHVVTTCLAKNPEDRFQTAHDVKLELKWVAELGTIALAPARKPRKRALTLAIAITMLVVALVIVGMALWPPSGYTYTVRSELAPPPKGQFHFTGDLGGPAIISPDGRLLAFSAHDEKNQQMLWLRPLDAMIARPLAGTDDGYYPFWSADSRSLGFFARGKLKRIDVAGGPAVELADLPGGGRGGAWNKDNTIVFSPDPFAAIYSVSANGGPPRQVTKLDKSRHTSHRWPSFLPDGRHFLYLAVSHTAGAHENDEIRVASLDGSTDRLILTGHANAQFASGRLLYLRDQSLVAQPFDASTFQLTGTPQVLADFVEYEPGWWNAVFSASRNGVLVYGEASRPGGTRLAIVDRSGKVLANIGEHDWFDNLRLSPDGQKLAVSLGQPTADLWVYDLSRGTRRRFTFQPTGNLTAAWSGDGKELFFSEVTGRETKILRKPVSGVGEAEPVFSAAGSQKVMSVSHDNRYLVYLQSDPGKTLGSLWILPLRGDAKSFAFLPEEQFFDTAEFSPDDRWIIYTRQLEVYVTDFAKHEGKWQISNGGGGQPRWSRDGKEIFYMTAAGDVMAVPVNTSSGAFETGEPKRLFHLNIPRVLTFQTRLYDVMPDGKRFVVNTTGEEDSWERVVLVTNWNAMLK